MAAAPYRAGLTCQTTVMLTHLLCSACLNCTVFHRLKGNKVCFVVDAGEIDVDTAIVAADPLCQQALECQAEDMAIEDTLYALERALTDGHLPADTYLKQVGILRISSYSLLLTVCLPSQGCMWTTLPPVTVTCVTSNQPVECYYACHMQYGSRDVAARSMQHMGICFFFKLS